MKAKKILLPLLIFFGCLFAFAGCTPKTQFDDMEIAKIETSWVEGFAPFPRAFLRTFDFKTGEVTDTRVTDADVSEMAGESANDYNRPKRIAAFTQEQATALYKKVKSLGFLTWAEAYETDEIIMDGGSQRVTVYFSDGTVKTTRIYFKYPPKYDEIRQTFEEYFGVNFYSGW